MFCRHVTQLSTNQIISVTPRDLNRLKMIVRKCEKQKQLQVSKLTDNFTEAVAKYHGIQKVFKDCDDSIIDCLTFYSL